MQDSALEDFYKAGYEGLQDVVNTLVRATESGTKADIQRALRASRTRLVQQNLPVPAALERLAG